MQREANRYRSKYEKRGPVREARRRALLTRNRLFMPNRDRALFTKSLPTLPKVIDARAAAAVAEFAKMTIHDSSYIQ